MKKSRKQSLIKQPFKNPIPDTNSMGSMSSLSRPLVAKDPPYLNRRRGAMRRRVHQVRQEIL